MIHYIWAVWIPAYVCGLYRLLLLIFPPAYTHIISSALFLYLPLSFHRLLGGGILVQKRYCSKSHRAIWIPARQNADALDIYLWIIEHIKQSRRIFALLSPTERAYHKATCREVKHCTGNSSCLWTGAFPDIVWNCHNCVWNTANIQRILCFHKCAIFGTITYGQEALWT